MTKKQLILSLACILRYLVVNIVEVISLSILEDTEYFQVKLRHKKKSNKKKGYLKNATVIIKTAHIVAFIVWDQICFTARGLFLLNSEFPLWELNSPRGNQAAIGHGHQVSNRLWNLRFIPRLYTRHPLFEFARALVSVSEGVIVAPGLE